MNKILLSTFAKLLTYPREEYSVYCRTALKELENLLTENPEKKEFYERAISKMEIFVSEIAVKTLGEREETFTQTFDINPIGNLEVGWHLYGEQYERGAFLVTCRELLRKYNIEETVELPDHVSHLIVLISEMEKVEAEKIASQYVLPAVEKVLLKLSEKQNVYENLLSAIKEILIAELEIGVKNYA